MSMNENANVGMKLTWLNSFATKIKEMTGYHLGTDHIHSDYNGWYYYIKEKSLEKNHPLLMMHYRGPMFAVIPYEEYALLESGELDPAEYINNAYWSYGYYWGGGSMLNGVFWQPLEKGTGINNKEMISRYLNILNCRTRARSSGYKAPLEVCQMCCVNSCPFSQHTEKNINANWEKEVKEHNYRVDLSEAFAQRIKEELNLKLIDVYCYHGNHALVIPADKKLGECFLYLPVKLLNDVLYNPGERDWMAIANTLLFEFGVMMEKEKLLYNPEEANMTASEYCRNFWSAFGYTEMVEDTDTTADLPIDIMDGASWFEKLKLAFCEFFKIRK